MPIALYASTLETLNFFLENGQLTLEEYYEQCDILGNIEIED